MPDKEQLRLEALNAARECWLQALRAAGLASRARQDAAIAQASRQALLQDLRSAGSAALQRLYQHAVKVAAENEARVVAEQAAARVLAVLFFCQDVGDPSLHGLQFVDIRLVLPTHHSLGATH